MWAFIRRPPPISRLQVNTLGFALESRPSKAQLRWRACRQWTYFVLRNSLHPLITIYPWRSISVLTLVRAPSTGSLRTQPTHTQPHSHTATQPHSHTATQPHSHTATRPHGHTATRPHSHCHTHGTYLSTSAGTEAARRAQDRVGLRFMLRWVTTASRVWDTVNRGNTRAASLAALSFQWRAKLAARTKSRGRRRCLAACTSGRHGHTVSSAGDHSSHSGTTTTTTNNNNNNNNNNNRRSHAPSSMSQCLPARSSIQTPTTRTGTCGLRRHRRSSSPSTVPRLAGCQTFGTRGSGGGDHAPPAIPRTPPRRRSRRLPSNGDRRRLPAHRPGLQRSSHTPCPGVPSTHQ